MPQGGRKARGALDVILGMSRKEALVYAELIGRVLARTPRLPAREAQLLEAAAKAISAKAKLPPGEPAGPPATAVEFSPACARALRASPAGRELLLFIRKGIQTMPDLEAAK